MRYNILINQVKALEWGLNIQQAFLMAFCYEVPTWATMILGMDGVTFYHLAKTKIATELPILTDKPDTIYRHLKTLEEKGLIVYKKHVALDIIGLTEKGKTWNSEKNPKSENIPNELGNFSENGSEKNPVYNTTNTDNVSKDKEAGQAPVSPEEVIDKKKRQFFNEVIFWVKANPGKYPKQLIFDFAKYWTEPNLKTKKIRRCGENYFDLSGRLATFFKRSSDAELSKMWEAENATDTLNKQLQTLLKN